MGVIYGTSLLSVWFWKAEKNELNEGFFFVLFVGFFFVYFFLKAKVSGNNQAYIRS